MLVIGLIYCITGYLLLKAIPVGKRRTHIAFSAFFFFSGVTCLLAQITKNSYCIYTAFFLPPSLILMWLFLNRIHLTIHCNEQISGIYLYSNKVRGKRRFSSEYAPVFRYDFNEKNYEQQVLESYPLDKLDSMFQVGNTYNIYMDPNNPKKCIYRKKISLWYYLLGIIGILFLGLYIHVMYIEYTIM